MADQDKEIFNSIKNSPDLQGENRVACVCYAYGSNDHKYYSVNMRSDNPKVRKVVGAIIGGKRLFCDNRYAFTVLKRLNTTPTSSFTNPFYNLLENQHSPIGFGLLSKRLYFIDNNNLYDDRYFSCAEKKVVDRMEKESVEIVKILTSKEPCYHCLPVIESIQLFRKDDLWELKRLPVSFNESDLTVYIYEMKII